MPMNKTMKVTSDTLYNLDKLKSYYIKKYPDRAVCYNLIIDELILEHIVYSNPENVEKRNKELLKNYINKNDYDDIFNKKMELEDKIIELTKKLEDSLKELEKLKADLNLAKEKYQKNINDLNNGLTAKQTELFLLNQKNNELTEKIMNLDISFKALQEKHSKINLDYICLKKYVDEETISKRQLKVMSFIAHFLYEHRFSKFTIDELIAGLVKFKSFDSEDYLSIEETLTLHNFFLIERIELYKVNYFRFDKKL